MQDLSEVKYDNELGGIDPRFLRRCRWDWVVEAPVGDLLRASNTRDRREAVESARERLQGTLEVEDFWTITPDSITAALHLTVLLYGEGKYSEEQVRSAWGNITRSPNAVVAPYSRCKGYWRWITEIASDAVDCGGTAIGADD